MGSCGETEQIMHRRRYASAVLHLCVVIYRMLNKSDPTEKERKQKKKEKQNDNFRKKKRGDGRHLGLHNTCGFLEWPFPPSIIFSFFSFFFFSFVDRTIVSRTYLHTSVYTYKR